MEYKYDKQADAIYIRFNDTPYAYGIDLDDERRVDYAADKTPVGVELLNVSRGVNLNGLPHLDEIAVIMKGKGIKVYEMQISDFISAGSNVVFEVKLGSPLTNVQDEQNIGFNQGVTA